ncbi:MAG: guanylate kinase [Halobacteriovoraceae bacterium]|nr:guanylate kinase [Halobacteriovoraceae bacterium]
MKGHIIIIVAPSGSGKSTLIKRMKKKFPNLSESVSHTSRPARKNEKNGVHYFFISENEFTKKIKNGDFLEWAKVHSNYYGTARDWVEKRCDNGDDLLFDLDVQGADAFKRHFGDHAKVVFIAPPSLEELEKRLVSRGTDPRKVIEIRLANAKKELKRKDSFDYLIYNDNLDAASGELENVFKKILRK